MKLRLCIVFLRDGSGAQPRMMFPVAFALYHTQAQKARFLVKRKALCGGRFRQTVAHRAEILTGGGRASATSRAERSNGRRQAHPGFGATYSRLCASSPAQAFLPIREPGGRA
jgi:hypothetical protein